MKVKYFIEEGNIFSISIQYFFNGEELVVWWRDRHIGVFLSSILNSDKPLYDLTLSCYNDYYIYENLQTGKLINDFIDNKVDIKKIVNGNVYESYNYLLANNTKEHTDKLMKDYANMLVSLAEMYQKRRNKIMNSGEFLEKDISKERIKDITHFAKAILLEEIYEEHPSDTIEKRLYSFLNANNGVYKDFLSYNCYISLAVVDCIHESDFDEWINTIVFAPKRDFYNLLNALQKKDYDLKIVSETEFSSFYEFILFVLAYMVQNKITLKVCKNCGKYFYPEKRSDAIFCDGISPQDITKTCKEYGRYVNQQNKIKETPTLKLHKQIYNAFRNQYNRDKTEENQKRLNDFMNKSDRFKNDVKHGVKAESEYFEWLERVKESGEIE